MIDSGEGITFDYEGMPMIYKQIYKSNQLHSQAKYGISQETFVLK